jgi:hypothetical protein
MTMQEFLEGDEMEQAEALWEYGVHIAEREDEVHRFILYQLNAFYVEAWYHKEYNVLRKFNVFDDMEQLQPYLEQIKIQVKS